jgi:biotin synthase
VGIAVDAATEPLFDALRGKPAGGPHRFDRYWDCLAEAVLVFGGRNTGVHLIHGLGETEQELTAAMARMRDMGGSTHLFSFYPESGTAMEGNPIPTLDSYRRVQLARYLIDHDLSAADGFRFDRKGRIARFGVGRRSLEEIVASGEPFRTSGCAGADGQPACNRPYSNSPPGPDIRNYPFPPWPEDLERIRTALGLDRPRSKTGSKLASMRPLG